jgi:uncharacterized membrane protein
VDHGQIGTTTLLAALGLAAPAWAQQAAPPYGPDMMWPGGWYGMMFPGPLMMLLLIAAVVVLVMLAVRWPAAPRPARRRAGPSRSSRSASPAARSTRRSSRSAAARSVSRRSHTEPNRSIPVHSA